MIERYVDSVDPATIKEQINDILRDLYEKLAGPWRITPIGGFAVEFYNDTSLTIPAGVLVETSSTSDFSVDTSDANELGTIGAVYEDIPSKSSGYVTIMGPADVLIKDGTTATAGNWCISSDVAGRADCTGTPPTGGTLQDHDKHFKEIGHCMQSKAAGTNVRVRILMHFN